jgi:hypothetical protein
VQNATPGRGGLALVTGSGYALLFVLGALEGVIGCFFYGAAIGPVPAAALGFAAAILVTTVLAAWGMQTPTGGLMPAVGWFTASFALAMATPGGSILITNTAAGKWFLYGGSACAAAGVVAAFVGLSGSRQSRAGR